MKFNVKKLVVSGMLTALAVALSTFSVPIGASKCFPIQHMVNVMAGVFLGPVYGVAIAFCTSLIFLHFREAWWGRCSADWPTAGPEN